MKLLSAIQGASFVIVPEFSPHNVEDVKKVLRIGKTLPDFNQKYKEAGLVFPAVTLTQNPGGSLTVDHQATIAELRQGGWPEEIEIIPHITGKDMNVIGVTSLLRFLAERGIETILALTGDKPPTRKARKVFELDSLGILQLIRQLNAERLKATASLDAFTAMPLLTAGAAVSPFKYTPGSMAMQYIKAAKKVREGAAFLVCQAGWDASRSELLIKELKGEGVPIMGNALVVNAAAARAMRTLPGCVVVSEFIDRLTKETEADQHMRAAQQIAMFRQLGYAGVDLGKPGDFASSEEIAGIVEKSLTISDWRAFRDNLQFAPPENPTPPLKDKSPVSWTIHSLALEKDGVLHGITKTLLSPFDRSAAREGLLYRLFNGMEECGKSAVYECVHCGDCYLPENEYVCTMGSCDKGLPNVPCGDADPRGYCGNDDKEVCDGKHVCVGEIIYRRLVKRNAVEAFKKRSFPPRLPALQNTSSLLNCFFGRDHVTRQNPLQGSGLIQIAEMIHATIPYAGAAMRYMQKLGPDGFVRSNRGLLAITELIRVQAEEGGDFIDLNIDALGAVNAPDLMRAFVRLVHRHSGGTPPCIDSSDINVLLAGLDEWVKLDGGKRPPLINSLLFSEVERYRPLLEYRRKSRFNLVCLLVGSCGPLTSVDAMMDAARSLFRTCREHGFAPGDLFFDTVTLNIGTDGFVDAMGEMKSSHTHNSFHTIKRICADEEMKGVHTVLGISNWVFGARKRRIGHLRAFIAVAQEYGLDAVISDVSKEFGLKEAPSELVDFVRMFVSLDGSDESATTYSEMTQRARESKWV
jgi:5,10-methylenetetrahydrofolate reductase